MSYNKIYEIAINRKLINSEIKYSKEELIDLIGWD